MGVSNELLEGPYGSRRRLFRGGACLSLAVLTGALLYRVFGHDLVRSLYRGEWPWLSHLVKRRGEHPVEYYLEIADRAVYGLLLWSVLVFLLYWALRELSARRPAWLLADPWWRRLTTVTAAVWLLFLLRIPLFQALPWWFWSLEDKPLPRWWLFASLALAGAGVLFAVSSRPHRHVPNLLLLVALCYTLQLGFGLMEGRGLQSLSDRLTGSGGHARLALAGTEWPPGLLLRSYPSMVAGQELPHFPHATKPPGPVIAFALLDQLAGHLPISGDDRQERVARLAALLFPLMASLTLLPLWGLCRLAIPGEREVWMPLLLYVSAPSLLLMVLHLDQCLFPLIGTTFLYLLARALTANRLLPAFAAGICLYAGLYFSFGLIALAVAAAALLLLFAHSGQAWKQAGSVATALIAGAALPHLAIWLGFGYDALAQFSFGMAAHQAFKFPQWGLGHTLYFGALNLVEFALWCGPALALLCGAQLYRSCRGWPPTALADLLVLALAVTLAGLLLFGRTAAETARLWLFLLPLVAIAGARYLGEITPGRGAGFLLMLQLVTVLVVKKFQDLF